MMSDPQLFNILRKVQLLEGVSNEHLEKLAAISRIVDIPEGKTIFREGDLASTVHLVVSGRVALEICAPGVGCKRILTVNEGELLGWSPLLDNEHLTATARTLAPTRTIAIGGQEIIELCKEHPLFGYEFMLCAALALGKRLSATRLQLLNLYGEDLPHNSPDEESEGAS